MLGDRRLADPELFSHGLHDRSRGLFAVGEQVEDAPAYGVTENVEGVHVLDCSERLNISQF